jgi:hypothetical protein
MRNGKSLRKKRIDHSFLAANCTSPIATAGEVFADGSTIELIGVRGGNPKLMKWDGAEETVGPIVEHGGCRYEPVSFDSTLLRELTLPTECRPHGTTRELLTDICKLAKGFADLPEKSAILTGRFLLCDWLVEAAKVAPALALVGLDTTRANQLLTLLHCLCRHGLRVTDVTPAGLRSLPTRAGFTLLISQTMLSDKLMILLDHASRRDQKIPYRSGLLDLFGAQVIYAESISFENPLSVRSIRIPMVPGEARLPVLDLEVQHRLTSEFQARLLSYRRANLSAACKLQFDSSKFVFPMRELAHNIAAATPDDVALQADVFELLGEEEQEVRAASWIGLSSIAVEAILVACYQAPDGIKYVGELAEIAQEILSRRGGFGVIDPGALGKRLRSLGFRMEPRDAKGNKLRVTEEVRRKAQQLARDLGAPDGVDVPLADMSQSEDNEV